MSAKAPSPRRMAPERPGFVWQPSVDLRARTGSLADPIDGTLIAVRFRHPCAFDGVQKLGELRPLRLSDAKRNLAKNLRRARYLCEKYPLLLLSTKSFDVPSCVGDAPSLRLPAHMLESVRIIYIGYDGESGWAKKYFWMSYCRDGRNQSGID
jgi:hypothetical protein